MIHPLPLQTVRQGSASPSAPFSASFWISKETNFFRPDSGTDSGGSASEKHLIFSLSSESYSRSITSMDSATIADWSQMFRDRKIDRNCVRGFVNAACESLLNLTSPLKDLPDS